MTAEDPYQRQLRLARERKRRYRDRHPNADASYRSRYWKATVAFRERHRPEYETLVALEHQRGTKGETVYWNSLAELRKRHPQEWTDTLAATS